MKLPIIIAAFSLLLIIPLASQNSFAQVNSGGFQAGGVNVDGSWSVSYTHLTLPTIYSV